MKSCSGMHWNFVDFLVNDWDINIMPRICRWMRNQENNFWDHQKILSRSLPDGVGVWGMPRQGVLAVPRSGVPIPLIIPGRFAVPAPLPPPAHQNGTRADITGLKASPQRSRRTQEEDPTLSGHVFFSPLSSACVTCLHSAWPLALVWCANKFRLGGFPIRPDRPRVSRLDR